MNCLVYVHVDSHYTCKNLFLYEQYVSEGPGHVWLRHFPWWSAPWLFWRLAGATLALFFFLYCGAAGWSLTVRLVYPAGSWDRSSFCWLHWRNRGWKALFSPPAPIWCEIWGRATVRPGIKHQVKHNDVQSPLSPRSVPWEAWVLWIRFPSWHPALKKVFKREVRKITSSCFDLLPG